jgi:Eco29kI restriction endonuclease
MNGYKEFEFDLPGALLASLIDIFDGMQTATLQIKNVKEIPDEQGVYQLLLNGQIVYVGKSDGDAGLRSRLLRHSDSIQHRDNLDVSQITYKAIRVFVFTAVDLETQLIRHYDSIQEVSWNKSGFGSNDPGRNREDTKLKANSFDALYPINIDKELDSIVWKNATTVADALAAIKLIVPYTFRYEMTKPKGKTPHFDLSSTQWMPSKKPASVKSLLVQILKALPKGWQATRLGGRVILYRESKDYEHGDVIGRS